MVKGYSTRGDRPRKPHADFPHDVAPRRPWGDTHWRGSGQEAQEMTRKRRTFSPAFKAKVALAVELPATNPQQGASSNQQQNEAGGFGHGTDVKSQLTQTHSVATDSRIDP